MNRSHPLILTLDQHGVPHRWVTWQQAVWYYAKERVAWETGREAFTIWGGRSHLTGERSSITANSIIAIRGRALAIKGFHQTPPLKLGQQHRQVGAANQHAVCQFLLGQA